MTPAANNTSLAETLEFFSLKLFAIVSFDLVPVAEDQVVGGIVDAEVDSPAAMLPRIHIACSCISLFGLESNEIKVGIVSA